jgi:hypothetical protein
VVQHQQANVPTTQKACKDCHYQQAAYQKNPSHTALGLACVQCHMPNLIVGAWGDPAKFSGDLPTHRMAIDPTQISQIDEAGDLISQITLDTACRHCHGAGLGSEKTDEELLQAAANYHTPPATP